jgi:hypothetical protein
MLAHRCWSCDKLIGIMHLALWRLLLTLSLLLTLPVQGYAAARMASCDAVLADALAASWQGAGLGDVQDSAMHHDGMQPDGLHHEGVHPGGTPGGSHDGTHVGPHDGAQGANHTAHGTSCMNCTPCSPGAALSCVVPVSVPFLSAPIFPELLIAPTSADLAHPERPPQYSLA